MIDHIERHERCAVLAAMGSGKSVATLTALDNLELVDPEGPGLIIAPPRVAAESWGNELAKYDHLAGKRLVPIVGTAKQRASALRDGGADFYSIGYQNLPWLVDRVGEDWPWQKVVADELTKLKGFRLGGGGGIRARSFGRVAHRRVRRFVGLTGTPAPNGLADLWGQLWFVDRGERLGRTHSAFMARWFSSNPYSHAIDPLPFAQEQIQGLISDVCLTVDPLDYIELDGPIVTKVPVLLPPTARAHYARMEKEFFTELQSGVEIEAFSAGAKSMKLAQIASGFVFDAGGSYTELHDAKLDALEQILDEANGMPVIVAYHFQPSLARLRKRFPYGKVPDDFGNNLEKEWNSGKHRLLFAHPQSVGHGINLQDGGNILAFYESWWSLEDHLQIIERLGPLRQLQAGHPRPVYIYYLLAENTIEERIFVRLDTKRSVQDVLLEYMKERL